MIYIEKGMAPAELEAAKRRMAGTPNLTPCFKELRGDESFYFNEKGELVITFDETDVAPAYMGAVEFAIPQSVTGTLE